MDKKERNVLLKISNQLKELRSFNEGKSYEKQGHIKALEEFHKPVIKKQEIEVKRLAAIEDKQNQVLDYIQDVDLNLQSLETSQEKIAPDMFMVKMDEGLDENYLNSLGLQLPSRIVLEHAEIDRSIHDINTQNKSLGGRVNNKSLSDEERRLIKEEIKHNQLYSARLRGLKVGFKVFNVQQTGTGACWNMLEKLCERPNQNVSQILKILEELLHRKEITNSNKSEFLANLHLA